MPANIKPTDGVRRDCHHPLANHVHGTHLAYSLDKCRCNPCREAHRIMHRHQERQRLYGRIDYVDPTPAREHVLALQAAGVGLKSQHLATGVSLSAYGKLIYGYKKNGTPPSKRIRSATRDRIMGLRITDYDRLPDRATVPADGTRRRVQALNYNGWPTSWVANQIGMIDTNLGTALKKTHLSAKTARLIKHLYDDYWSTPAPEGVDHYTKSARAKTIALAKRRGYAPPLAWDDIDNPDEQPQLGGKPKRDQVLPGEVEWLLDSGVPGDQIHTRVGYSATYHLKRKLATLGRHDLSHRLTNEYVAEHLNRSRKNAA
jgi:hypothetical protein